MPEFWMRSRGVSLTTPDALPDRLEDVAVKPLLSRMFTSFRWVFSGFVWTLSRRELRAWAAASVLLNVVVYAALLVLGFSVLDDVEAFLRPDAGMAAGFWRSVWEAGASILKFLVFVLWGLVSVFLALGIGNVVCSPIYDVLSERTEEIWVGRPLPQSSTWLSSVTGGIRELIIQLILLAFYLPMTLGILLLGVVPVVGQVIAPILAWSFAALWFAITFTSQSAARHGLTVFDRLGLVFRHKGVGVGFGGFQGLISFVPVVPVLVMPLLTPAFVVGGTRLFLTLAAYDRVPSRLSEADKAVLRGAP